MTGTNQPPCDSHGMTNRSAWWRTSAGVVAWCVLTLAAAGTAWAAVAVVRNETTGPIPLPVTSNGASTPTASSGGASPARNTERFDDCGCDVPHHPFARRHPRGRLLG